MIFIILSITADMIYSLIEKEMKKSSLLKKIHSDDENAM